MAILDQPGSNKPRNSGRWSLRLGVLGRAQAAVEFALVAPIVLIVLLIAIQFAIIGVAALGLGQIDYQGARYAAIHDNDGTTSTQVQTYMLSAASPIIGANSGKYLTVNVNTLPCAYSGTVTVAVSFDVNHLIMLPNPFMGVINFPSKLTNSQSAFCE
jgi:Flp pilus assembly protein TadG